MSGDNAVIINKVAKFQTWILDQRWPLGLTGSILALQVVAAMAGKAFENFGC